VGLLSEGTESAEWPPPVWARTVIIDDPALHEPSHSSIVIH
jgi:hypothetical protein